MSNTTTKYATPEQAIRCAETAKMNGKRDYIDDDTAREYVMKHRELCKKIVQASVLMYKARYEWELSQELGEDDPYEDAPHFDKSYDHWMKAAQVRDEAVKMLDDDADLDDLTREWLKWTYLDRLLTL